MERPASTSREQEPVFADRGSRRMRSQIVIASGSVRETDSSFWRNGLLLEASNLVQDYAEHGTMMFVAGFQFFQAGGQFLMCGEHLAHLNEYAHHAYAHLN